MSWTMVVIKTTKRKREKSDGIVDDYQVLDLTDDEIETEEASMSESEGRESSKNRRSSSFKREFQPDDEDEKKLRSFGPSKGSPVVKYARKNRVQGQIPTISELQGELLRDSSKVVLPVHSIQPATNIGTLYVEFSEKVVEVRGGDNKKILVHTWPLQSISKIRICYRSEWEEDTRVFVTIRVFISNSWNEILVSGKHKRIEEFVLELLKIRDSVDEILKLSPYYRGVMDDLSNELVDESSRKIEIQNSPTCASLFPSSSEEGNVEKSDRTIERLNSQTCTSSIEEFEKAIAAFNVLVYPEGDPDAVTITQKDLKILKPYEFLNDTIIDFYIKYLQQTIVSSEKLRSLHFFNSFFFSKLAEDDAFERAAFERVKKWTRKVNVFEKDFVFIPVNQSLHWSLIIICHPGHMWAVPTENGSSEGDACILHLDSMEGCHRGVEAHIKNYLIQEWLERNKDPEDKAHAEQFFLEMPFRYSKVPQQDNNCDCGLFLLHYVELFLKTAPSIYRMRRQSNPPSQFLRRNWFKPSEASAKRLVIPNLILELAKARSSDSGRDENKENAPADAEVLRPTSTSLRADKQSASPSTPTLDRVRSDSPSLRELLIKNGSLDRFDEIDLNDVSTKAVSSGRQDQSAEVQRAACNIVSVKETAAGDSCRGRHHDQSKIISETDTNQSSTQVLVVDDDVKSELETILPPKDESYENYPLPKLPIQVKPLKVPPLLPSSRQPFAVIDLGSQEVTELQDESPSSLSNKEAKKPEMPLDFGSVVLPENDDEMYESAKQRRASLNSLVHLSSTGSPKKDKHVEEGGISPAKFYGAKASPLGRCSESNMQGALWKRSEVQPRVLTQKDTNQEVQEIQDLSSDDSSDSSSQRWDFRMRSLDAKPNVKRPLKVETTGPRVTRSVTQSTRGLAITPEKQTQNDALDRLLRKRRESRRR